jgi:hypothetical protein
MQVHFAKRFTIETDDGKVKVYPAGWRGEAPDDHGEAANAAGALKAVRTGAVPAFIPKAAPIEEPVDIDGMKRAELDEVATGLGLDPSDYSNKADLISAIKAK